jgi:hypothetical protein
VAAVRKTSAVAVTIGRTTVVVNAPKVAAEPTPDNTNTRASNKANALVSNTPIARAVRPPAKNRRTNSFPRPQAS